MYIRLRLRNWRSIEDADIILAPFTVVVGKNSSGKSNLIDALLFASEVGRDAATAVSRRGGIVGIRRWSPSKPYQITLDVCVAASEDALKVSSSRHEMVIGSGRQGEWKFLRETITLTEGGKQLQRYQREGGSLTIQAAQPIISGIPSGTSVGIADTTSAMLFARQLGRGTGGRLPPWLAQVRSLRPVPELMRRPQPIADSAKLDETASNVATALHRMTAVQRGVILESMRRIIPGLVDVQTQANGRYLTLVFTQQHAADRRPDFAATEMSDGALRALAVIIAAQQMAQHELLLIEEPEVNLHPGAARVVYDALSRAARRGAVLITTHSPELLDHAREDTILVCEYANGTTRVGPLASAQRALVREGLYSTAELMRAEELRREGATPRVVQAAQG